MDIEGAEWDSLMATPDEVLERIDQMPMELHGANEQRFVDVIRKLKRTFYVVSLHFNNWACTGDAAPMPGWAYQVLLVNKRLGELDPSTPGGGPGARQTRPIPSSGRTASRVENQTWRLDRQKHGLTLR